MQGERVRSVCLCVWVCACMSVCVCASVLSAGSENESNRLEFPNTVSRHIQT